MAVLNVDVIDLDGEGSLRAEGVLKLNLNQVYLPRDDVQDSFILYFDCSRNFVDNFLFLKEPNLLNVFQLLVLLPLSGCSIVENTRVKLFIDRQLPDSLDSPLLSFCLVDRCFFLIQKLLLLQQVCDRPLDFSGVVGV